LLTKPPLDEFVGSVKFTAKIVRQENETDDDTPDHVSQHDLQEHQVGVIGQSGNANDGESAGFRCDDGERNRPPWDIAIGEKIVPQRALLLAEAQPEERNPRQVQPDNREVKLVQAHKPTYVAAGDSPARASESLC